MNISDNSKYMVFKKDGQYGPMYSIGLSKKNQDGNYENGYMPVRFKKGVELEDRTEIYIKNAWLTFYKKDKITVPYIFINEFEETKKEEKDPYEEFSENTDLSDLEEKNMLLPF